MIGRLDRRIGGRETLVLGVTLAGLMIVTSLPYAFGYLSATADQHFTGIMLDVPDTAQYLSWARESAHAVLIENKLTPEHGEAVFFNLFWLGVGRLGATLGLGWPETLQLVRPVAGSVYLAAIYWFVSLLVQTRLHRWVAFLSIALGGGLGWLLVIAKQVTGQLAFPLDLYVTEPNTFLTIMAFPHQAMATGLLVLVLGLAALALERSSFRLATLAGVLALALGLQHGYDLVVVYGVVASVWLLLAVRGSQWRRQLGICALICGLSVPAAVYLVFLTRASSIWRGVLAQYGNAGVYTPPPAHLLVLLGLPLLLVIGGYRGAPLSADRSPRELFLRVWLVVGALLLYLPTDFQVKMLAGWQVPVGIMATRVLFTQIAPALQRGWRSRRWRLDVVLGALFVAAVLPANAYLFTWRFVDLGRHEYPYYLHSDDVTAMRWLEANADPSDTVLSSLTIGQFVPSIAGNHAFLAHWAQTLDFYTKQQLVTRFFDSNVAEPDRRALLAQYDVRYVFYGSPERALGAFDPSQSPALTEVYSSPHASVFMVESVHP